eukprot:232542_1
MLYRLGLTAVVFTSLVSVGIGGLPDHLVKAREEAVVKAIEAIVKRMFEHDFDEDKNGVLSQNEGKTLAKSLVQSGVDSKGVVSVSHKQFLDWLGDIIDFEQYAVDKKDTKDAVEVKNAKSEVLKDVGDSIAKFLLGPKGIKEHRQLERTVGKLAKSIASFDVTGNDLSKNELGFWFIGLLLKSEAITWSDIPLEIQQKVSKAVANKLVPQEFIDLIAKAKASRKL